LSVQLTSVMIADEIPFLIAGQVVPLAAISFGPIRGDVILTVFPGYGYAEFLVRFTVRRIHVVLEVREDAFGNLCG